MQSVVLSIAVAMVGGAIISMAIPKGNMKKVMIYTLNLFFISSLLSPFILNLPKIDFNYIVGNIDSEALQDNTEKQTIDLCCETLRKSLLKVLEESGYNVEDLNIEINLEGQNCSIEVMLNEEEKSNETKIAELIKEQTAINPRILYVG